MNLSRFFAGFHAKYSEKLHFSAKLADLMPFFRVKIDFHTKFSVKFNFSAYFPSNRLEFQPACSWYSGPASHNDTCITFCQFFCSRLTDSWGGTGYDVRFSGKILVKIVFGAWLGWAGSGKSENLGVFSGKMAKKAWKLSLAAPKSCSL